MAADEKPAGVDALHPRVSLPILVAPSDGPGAFNRLAPPTAPTACWRLEDARFEFDSSIVRPSARPEQAALAALWERANRPALSIFGHADPVGDDEYNKTLSGRRARAIYGMLTRDVEIWEKLYSQPFSTDNWQTGALDRMRATTRQPAGSDRKTIFKAYMDAICQKKNGEPFIVEKSNFLAQGKDPDGKGDYQGCGEFNPILLFSKTENQQLQNNREQRNRENEPNRRVLVFLFPPGLSIDPASWPCPRAGEASSGCRAHFWADGEKRRAFGERRREYASDKNTFACAFYDSMARRSPCEVVRQTLRIRILDLHREPCGGAAYRLQVAGDLREGHTAPDGWLVENEVVAPGSCVLEWAAPAELERNGVYSYRLTLALGTGAESDEELARRRLGNLGYAPGKSLEGAVHAFQVDYQVEPADGTLNAATRARLAEVHDRQLTRSGA